MKSNNIFLKIRNNAFLTLCFTTLLSLCVYQTWPRKKENTIINHLTRIGAMNEDKEHLFDNVQLAPSIIDSLNKLDKDKLLVLRFLRNDCRECIDSIFSNLSNVAKKVGKENVAVLVDEPNFYEYLKYKRLYLLFFSVQKSQYLLGFIHIDCYPVGAYHVQ